MYKREDKIEMLRRGTVYKSKALRRQGINNEPKESARCMFTKAGRGISVVSRPEILVRYLVSTTTRCRGKVSSSGYEIPRWRDLLVRYVIQQS